MIWKNAFSVYWPTVEVLAEWQAMGTEKFFELCKELANRIIEIALEVKEETRECALRGGYLKEWEHTYRDLSRMGEISCGFVVKRCCIRTFRHNPFFFHIEYAFEEGHGVTTFCYFYENMWGHIFSRLNEEEVRLFFWVVERDYLMETIHSFKTGKRLLAALEIDPDNPPDLLAPLDPPQIVAGTGA